MYFPPWYRLAMYEYVTAHEDTPYVLNTGHKHKTGSFKGTITANVSSSEGIQNNCNKVMVKLLGQF
jgi:hypothetical protein